MIVSYSISFIFDILPKCIYTTNNKFIDNVKYFYFKKINLKLLSNNKISVYKIELVLFKIVLMLSIKIENVISMPIFVCYLISK